MTADDYIKIASAVISELFFGLFVYRFACSIFGLSNDEPKKFEVSVDVSIVEPEE